MLKCIIEGENMENSKNFNGAFVSNLEEKTDRYIRQIDKNHASEVAPLGKHAKPIEVNTTALRKIPPRYDYEKDHADIRWKAAINLQQRLEKNKVVKEGTRKLTFGKTVGKIIATGLIAVAAGTCVGTVAAYYSTNILNMNDTGIEQNDNVITPVPIENDQKIIPTQAEYEAGLTQEQLAQKRALDAKENAELRAFVEAGQQQTQEYNSNQEELTNSKTR